MPPVFLEHPSSLEHDTGVHPEQPARITAIERELESRGWMGFERVRSPKVDPEALSAVHSLSYVSSVEQISARGGGALDLDTVVSRGSYEAALHAAGGAVRMVEMLLDGEASCAFSAHRPPGHHAERARGMGFCLFNNVAIAASFALRARGLERVMILDWDVHHGNGTNDIFHSSDRVLFVSIHQWPLYPGTGPPDDAGSGEGVGFTVNIPVLPGSDDAVYESLVEHVAVPLALRFQPQLLLISAGYDAHREDPLAQCRVSERAFMSMARAVRRAGEALGAHVGAVLEGGYALGPLSRSVAATLEGLTASGDGDGAGVELTPIAREALERLERWWPGLG